MEKENDFDIPKYEGFEKKKTLYQKLEDNYYTKLENINKKFPILKITDAIDKIMPSFIFFIIFSVLILFLIIFIVILLVIPSDVNVLFEFYLNDNPIDEDLNIFVVGEDFSYYVLSNNSSLNLKLKANSKIKLKVLTKGYEIEKNFTIDNKYFKVNIEKNKEIVPENQKINITFKISRQDSPLTIYNSLVNLHLKCLSSKYETDLKVSGQTVYEKDFNCGILQVSGVVDGFKDVSKICDSTICNIFLATQTDNDEEVEELIPKNNLIITAKSSNALLEDVNITITKINEILGISQITNSSGIATFNNLNVGYYKISGIYSDNNKIYYSNDSNYYVDSGPTKTKLLNFNLDTNDKKELNIFVDTNDDEEIKVRYYLYDVNGVELVANNLETPDKFSIDLNSGVYYLSLFPNDAYMPIYLNKIDLTSNLDKNYILKYNPEDYITLKIKTLYNYEGANNVNVFVYDVDNNKLIYDKGITNSEGIKDFILPKKDYLIYAIKNEKYENYYKFDYSESKIILGVYPININLNEMGLRITLNLKHNNKDVNDYEIFYSYNDVSDVNYVLSCDGCDGKLIFDVPRNKSINPIITFIDIDNLVKYVFHYNNLVFTNTTKDVLNLNITDKNINKDVIYSDIYGSEAKLIEENRFYYLPIDVLSTYNLDKGKFDINLSMFNFYDSNIYDFKLNYSKFNFASNPKKNIQLLPYKLYFIVDDVSSDEYLTIKNYYRLLPEILTLDKTKDMNNIFKVVNLKDNFDLNYEIVVGKANDITDLNFEPIIFSSKENIDKILVDYTSGDVNCEKYFCSLYNFIGYSNSNKYSNKNSNKMIYLSEDYNYDRLIPDLNTNLDINYKGLGRYKYINNNYNFDTNLEKLNFKDHIFYHIPYYPLNLVSWIFSPIKLGACVNNTATIKYSNNSNILECGNSIIKLNVSRNLNLNTAMYAKRSSNNPIDLNLNYGIGIAKCNDSNYNECYDTNAIYYAKNENNYYSNLFDINNISQNITLKPEFFVYDVELIAIKPLDSSYSVKSGWKTYKIESLQDVIDYYNDDLIYFESTKPIVKNIKFSIINYYYYWNFKEILLKS